MSTQEAIADVIRGAKNYEFWMTFGLKDITTKYRRSKLGQLWITLSVALFVFVIGGLYKSLLGSNYPYYLTYITIGYVVWLFMQSIVSSGCLSIVEAKPFIFQQNWPAPTFIFRLLYREMIAFLHYGILIFLVFILEDNWPSIWQFLVGFVGLALTVFTAFWVALFLSIISLRFRDIIPIVQSVMRMAFFATPVIWVDRDLGKFGELVVLLNPFGYFVKIVRDPLMGQHVSHQDWFITIAISLCCMFLALFLLGRERKNISFWL